MLEREGIGPTLTLASSCSMRRGPHPGCCRRISQIAASSSAGVWCEHESGRCDRSASDASPTLCVTAKPAMDALTGHPEPSSDLHDLPTVLNHREHRLIALFHDTQLHQHPLHLPSQRAKGECQASAEVSVKDQPKQASSIRWNCVKAQAMPLCRGSSGARQ
jgi:hypothetical protein